MPRVWVRMDITWRAKGTIMKHIIKLSIVSILCNFMYSGIHVGLNEFDITYLERVGLMLIFDVLVLHWIVVGTKKYL